MNKKAWFTTNEALSSSSERRLSPDAGYVFGCTVNLTRTHTHTPMDVQFPTPKSNFLLHKGHHSTGGISLSRSTALGDETQWKERPKNGQTKPTDPSIERVKEGVASAISHSTASMGLTSLAVLQTLPAKRSLVDLPVLRATKRHPIVLQLDRKRKIFFNYFGIIICK